jgi:hypothetical protein
MIEPPSLIADRVLYFHQSDEAMFFAWLDRMGVVSGYEGRGDGLHIRLGRHPSDEDLRELIAFHQRYGIDMRQLAALRTPQNRGLVRRARHVLARAGVRPGRILNRPVADIALAAEGPD